MEIIPVAAEIPPEIETPSDKFKCGTLQYTAIGLGALFFWLLWGDFIFSLIDGAVPGILPLKLQTMGASDTVNQLLNKSLTMALTFLVAPRIGVKSDRHRSKFGRRIPFLAWSTPFVGLFMILLGCQEHLVQVLMGTADHLTLNIGSWHPVLGRRAISLWMFGLIFAGFDYANVFVNTIYWYLFNDVVPQRVMSRFMALFRMTGVAAGAAYNAWIKPHALDHFNSIFIYSGIAYIIGFTAMCLFVKEGEYPPSGPAPAKSSNFLSETLRMMWVCVVECATAPIYIYFFLHCTLDLLAMVANNFSQVAYVQSMHLTLKQLGMIGVYTATPIFLLQLPAGWVADKYGPIRVYVFSRWITTISLIISLVWIFTDFGRGGDLKLLYVLQIAFLPFNALGDAAGIPMYMQLLPRERFGQFCSANAMFRSFFAIFASLAAGMLMDALKIREHVPNWHYRFVPAWALTFQIPSLICMTLMFAQWKKLGGRKHYVPPGLPVPATASLDVAKKNLKLS